MACATPTAPSTKETTNYARLCRLLVELGTHALRDTFNSIHAPVTLYTALAGNKTVLQSLRRRKIINPTQWGKLFPTIPTSVSSASFDITLLMVLLRNICGLVAPATGWDALPAATDVSPEADIARIKYFRNTVYAHAEHASVDDTTFESHWRDIRESLVRLGGVQYRTAIDNLKTECMDVEAEQHYIGLLEQWKKDEINVKELLEGIGSKVMKRLDEITTEVRSLKSSEKINGSIKCKEKYHENEPVEYFCEECKVCICHKCGQTGHNHHNKKDLQHAAEDIKSKMENMISKINAKAVSVEAKVKEQTNLMLKSQEEIFSAERQMVKAVEETIRLLNKHREEMKMKLAEIREAQQREHEKRIKQFQMVATQIDKSAENGKVFLQRVNGPEILETQCAAVLTGLERLLNDEEMEIYKPRRVTYRVNKECVLGEIVEFEPHSPAAVQEERTMPTENLCRFDESPIQAIVKTSLIADGITKLHLTRSIAVSEKTGNIAVVERNNHGVHLFDSEWKFLRTIGEKGTGAELMDEPRSVAFMSSGNILVVQSKPSSGHKLSVFTERGHYITDISEHLLKFPRNVSVRSYGKLLVCDWKDKAVKVLSPDGTSLIQTLKAPYCNEHPWFAIHHQGMFYVSYESLHCVKIFSDEGQLLYKIGCKGTGDGQLRNPQGLAIDKFNNLVVCDRGNERLQFFSLEGKFLKSVTEGISRPWCVAVAKNGDLLFSGFSPL